MNNYNNNQLDLKDLQFFLQKQIEASQLQQKEEVMRLRQYINDQELIISSLNNRLQLNDEKIEQLRIQNINDFTNLKEQFLYDPKQAIKDFESNFKVVMDLKLKNLDNSINSVQQQQENYNKLYQQEFNSKIDFMSETLKANQQILDKNCRGGLDQLEGKFKSIIEDLMFKFKKMEDFFLEIFHRKEKILDKLNTAYDSLLRQVDFHEQHLKKLTDQSSNKVDESQVKLLLKSYGQDQENKIINGYNSLLMIQKQSMNSSFQKDTEGNDVKLLDMDQAISKVVNKVNVTFGLVKAHQEQFKDQDKRIERLEDICLINIENQNTKRLTYYQKDQLFQNQIQQSDIKPLTQQQHLRANTMPGQFYQKEYLQNNWVDDQQAKRVQKDNSLFDMDKLETVEIPESQQFIEEQQEKCSNLAMNLENDTIDNVILESNKYLSNSGIHGLNPLRYKQPAWSRPSYPARNIVRQEQNLKQLMVDKNNDSIFREQQEQLQKKQQEQLDKLRKELDEQRIKFDQEKALKDQQFYQRLEELERRQRDDKLLYEREEKDRKLREKLIEDKQINQQKREQPYKQNEKGNNMKDKQKEANSNSHSSNNSGNQKQQNYEQQQQKKVRQESQGQGQQQTHKQISKSRSSSPSAGISTGSKSQESQQQQQNQRQRSISPDKTQEEKIERLQTVQSEKMHSGEDGEQEEEEPQDLIMLSENSQKEGDNNSQLINKSNDLIEGVTSVQSNIDYQNNLYNNNNYYNNMNVNDINNNYQVLQNNTKRSNQSTNRHEVDNADIIEEEDQEYERDTSQEILEKHQQSNSSQLDKGFIQQSDNQIKQDQSGTTLSIGNTNSNANFKTPTKSQQIQGSVNFLEEQSKVNDAISDIISQSMKNQQQNQQQQLAQSQKKKFVEDNFNKSESLNNNTNNNNNKRAYHGDQDLLTNNNSGINQLTNNSNSSVKLSDSQQLQNSSSSFKKDSSLLLKNNLLQPAQQPSLGQLKGKGINNQKAPELPPLSQKNVKAFQQKQKQPTQNYKQQRFEKPGNFANNQMQYNQQQYGNQQGQQGDFEEIVYQLDEDGFLMDENGNYLLDEEGKFVRLTNDQLDDLRNQNLIVEEDVY